MRHIKEPQEPARTQEPVVVTVGEATVRRPSDRALVTISVETRAKSPRDAQRQNAEAMTAVQQRLSQARRLAEAKRLRQARFPTARCQQVNEFRPI